jgi:hypothetical protein
MRSFQSRWRGLFLFSLGIAISTTFIMQWLATDFWLDDRKFSILGLELFYSKKEVISVLTQIKQPARIALNYQLIFDFAFMTGIYPAIASSCMLIRENMMDRVYRNVLFALAMVQPVAWAFDITENIFLLGWMDKPGIGDEFGLYHNIVVAKWLIALAGALCAIVFGIIKPGRTRQIQGRQHRNRVITNKE